MAEKKPTLLQKQVEEILKAKGVQDNLPALVASCNAILSESGTFPPPEDMICEVLYEVIKIAFRERPPKSAVHTAFALGRAYERWKNEHRA